jgi:hypothetical protein
MSNITEVFLVIPTVLFIIFVIWQMARQIRSIRLRKIAQKYNLSYQKRFHLFYPDSSYNEISGRLKSHSVKVYDSVSRKDMGDTNGIYSYRTILQIDGDQAQSKEGYFAKISYIEDQFKKLTT